MYDFQISPDTSLHFGDDKYIYIAAKRNDTLCYLVYNPCQITPNILVTMMKFEQKDKPLLGQIWQHLQRRGFGILNQELFFVSDTEYEGDLDLEFERNDIIRNYTSFAVRNHREQLALVNFNVVIDLKKSFVEYKLGHSVMMLKNSSTSLNFSLDLKNLSGPVSSIDIKSTCEYWPRIDKNDIYEREDCISSDAEFQLGRVRSFVSFGELEIVVTTDMLLCIQNRSVVTRKLLRNVINCAPTDCILKDFSSPSTAQAIMICWCWFQPYLRLISAQDCGL